jgi:7,8-dihydro-6-hydroxymethylpterin dimethyltransferase
MAPSVIELAGAPGDQHQGEVFHSYSRGLCPACNRLVDGGRVIRGGKVFLRKYCPTHGASEALISGDAEWFLASLTYLKPGSVPLEVSTEVASGCPLDCGLCADHEQHTCLPIIEITNHCNLECPICLVQNRHDAHLSREDFGRIIDGLVAKEGQLETVNLSGGEPTLHPAFLELLDLALARKEIARVSVATNGLRLAADPGLCDELARRGVYVNLQLDAPDDRALGALRGAGAHQAVRMRALANLERAGVRTTLIATVAKGVNDGFIGDCVKLLYERDGLLSLTFQPAAFIGTGAAFGPHDPQDILTVPDVVAAIEAQTGGRLVKSDFLPLPCSHPACFGLTYLLKTETGLVPFPRFLGLARYLDLITNRGTLQADAGLEQAIRDAMDELWTGSAQVPDSEKILRALKRSIQLLYPERALELEQRLRVGEALVKTIFIHAYMDAHTFEVERVRKCCTHYALPDGRLMPACSYNALYRAGDRRQGPRP